MKVVYVEKVTVKRIRYSNQLHEHPWKTASNRNCSNNSTQTKRTSERAKAQTQPPLRSNKRHRPTSHSGDEDPDALSIGLRNSDELIELYLHILFRRLVQLHLPARVLLVLEPILTEDASQTEIELCVGEVHAETLAGSLGKRYQVAVEAGVFEPALWTELVRGGKYRGVLVDQGRRHADRYLHKRRNICERCSDNMLSCRGNEETYSWWNLPISFSIEEPHDLIGGHPL